MTNPVPQPALVSYYKYGDSDLENLAYYMFPHLKEAGWNVVAAEEWNNDEEHDMGNIERWDDILESSYDLKQIDLVRNGEIPGGRNLNDSNFVSGFGSARLILREGVTRGLIPAGHYLISIYW